MSHELCSFHPALFDSPKLLKQANRSPVADAIWKPVNQTNVKVEGSVKFILEGGSLNHRIPWNTFSTYVSCMLTIYKDGIHKLPLHLMDMESFRQKTTPISDIRGAAVVCQSNLEEILF